MAETGGRHVNKERSPWVILSEIVDSSSPFQDVSKTLKAVDFKQQKEFRNANWGIDDVPPTMNLDKLVEEDPTLADLLSIIRDPDTFLSKFFFRETTQHYKGSSAIEKFVEKLTKMNVIREIPRRQAKLTSLVFTIPKVKKKLMRLIMDWREGNACMEDTGKMHLPSLQEIEDFVNAFSWLWETDGKSWFNQVPVHPDIQPYFAFRAGGKVYVWTRMIMGWKYAPLLGQSIMRSLIRIANLEALCYIDNVYGGANEKCQAEADMQQFLDTCRRFDVTMDVSTSPSQEGKVLGVWCDLSKKEVSLPAEFVTKLESLLSVVDQLFVRGEKVCPSARLIWQVLGHINWSRRILGLKPAPYFRFFFWMKKTAGALSRLSTEVGLAKAWSSSLHINRAALEDLKQLLTDIIANKPRSVKYVDAPFEDAYGDASDWGQGYVLGDFLGVTKGFKWSERMRNKHIAIRELHAARTTLEAAKRRGMKYVNLHVDNTNVYSWLTKGNPGPAEAALIVTDIIRSMKEGGVTWKVTWIPSEENIADAPSRGEV